MHRERGAAITDWLALWRELAEAFVKPDPDANDGLVERYRAHDSGKSWRPDELLDFVLAHTEASDAVLDIGAGTGRWTVPLADKVRRVTALEPAPGMAEMLRANLSEAGAANVVVVDAGWEHAAVGPHDVTVAAHSMYTSPDLAGFVRFMEEHARRACFMELRIPPADGLIGQLSLRIHGHLHDSPNAVIAYNALYALGIDANVLVETDVRYRVEPTLEEAFERTKSHLRLDTTTEYDDLVLRTLEEGLTRVDDGWRWPDGKRSALLWWQPRHARSTMGRDP
ncbi:MAG: class I SAM-dependent methyltransferase [Actinobacteria bacterium]|nr:class I SAM-dependent methyltransferase [Actinomycetota bacterium]